MNDIAHEQRAYAEAGPWDRLGALLRIGLAVLFLLITVVFFATAQDGLVGAGEWSALSTATSTATAQPPAN